MPLMKSTKMRPSQDVTFILHNHNAANLMEFLIKLRTSNQLLTIKQIRALAFLPPPDVSEAFNVITENPDPNFKGIH